MAGCLATTSRQPHPPLLQAWVLPSITRGHWIVFETAVCNDGHTAERPQGKRTLSAATPDRFAGYVGISEKVVWAVVKECAAKAGITQLAPHDLRRTCAKLCHIAGGELEQIQLLPGHVSVQTTEHYLGCQKRLKDAVNDCIGIEPKDMRRCG